MHVINHNSFLVKSNIWCRRSHSMFWQRFNKERFYYFKLQQVKEMFFFATVLVFDMTPSHFNFIVMAVR